MEVKESEDSGEPPETIFDTIPEGIELRQTNYGMGLFATRFFPQGSELYVGRQIVIPNSYREHRLLTNQGSFLLNSDTHAVRFSDTQRWFFLSDSFMNHSCDANVRCPQSEAQAASNTYSTVAIKNINEGDEITCDYNLFEYDCAGKVIEICQCGTSKCRGSVRGFKYLSKKEQEERLQEVDEKVLYNMALDPLNNFYFFPEVSVPASVRIEILNAREGHAIFFVSIKQFSISNSSISFQGEYSMVAARDFAANEVIFENESKLVPGDANIVLIIHGTFQTQK
jgi:hypothetical protein